MNETLKQIAIKAQVEHCISHVRLQEFAELIVAECMAMCKTAVGNADYNTGRLHCLNNIKEHFGVEND